MLRGKLYEITPGSVADYLIRLAVLVLLHIWLMNARDKITKVDTGLLSKFESEQTNQVRNHTRAI